jgi:serine/threonine-protein kinase
MSGVPHELVGTTLDGYSIEAGLGSGANADIYLATHPHLQRKVAVKVSSSDSRMGVDAGERLRREGALLASFDHPGIPHVYGHGESDGVVYIAMAYAESRDLLSCLERDGPLSLAVTLSIVDQLASAVDALHAADIVHTDVKLSNILVGSGERIYLSDLGRARHTDEHPALLGARAYDIAAVAGVAYRCLLGVPATELDALIANREGMRAIASARRDVPASVDGVLAGVSAQPPAYPTAAALARSLHHAAATPPTFAQAGRIRFTRVRRLLGTGRE